VFIDYDIALADTGVATVAPEKIIEISTAKRV
jgi:hypothetical protein